MQLNFRSHEFGFTLKNKVPLKNLKEGNFEDISPYIELLVTSENEVAFVEWPFFENPLKEIEVELPYFRKNSIPGRYDVPELGVKNATFVEVLEAVKRYYEKNLKKTR